MRKRVLLLVLPAVLVLLAASLLVWRQFRPAERIPVGLVAWAASGAVVGSREWNAADLFLEEHPDSLIRLLPLDDEWNPDKTAPVIDRIILPSPHRSRHQDLALDDYFRRFRARFGYEAHGITVGVVQALELLDRAFAQGATDPLAVKQFLLSVPVHQTSLGSIAFDRTGDVSGSYHFITDPKQELQ